MNYTSFYQWVFIVTILLASPSVFGQNTSTAPAGVDKLDSRTFVNEPDAYAPEHTYAPTWTTISSKDILWGKRIWRIMDTRDTANKLLNHLTVSKATLATVLVEGVSEGDYKAYSNSDDRFTKELSKEDFSALIQPAPTAGTSGFTPAAATKYQIKEDWIYLAKEHKLIVRIIGIAPLKDIVAPDGSVKSEPVFWLYYPTIRTYLAAQRLNNSTGAQNLDQLFENREFKSKIDKIGQLF